MFDPTDTPRLFGLPPGVDFPAAFLRGLDRMLEGQPPEAIGRVEVIVNTTRMRRRLRSLLDNGPPRIQPRLRLLTESTDPRDMAGLPNAVPPLRRRLELAQLVARLLDADPTLAPRNTLFDLADSLASLMDEMQGEGVSPENIAALDVSDQSGHWQRALRFLKVLQPYFELATDAPDTEALQRQSVLRRIARWQANPPRHPVILAGSTGSRGTTRLLMEAVARLPQGAVVLPGFDFDMPAPVWDTLGDALTGEDHPQFRFARLMVELGLRREAVARWDDTPPPSPARNAVLSLALRPAPVTDQWLRDGPFLPDLSNAMANVTLVEAASPRDEALAIALRLRQAAEDGQTAALITPDRMLTRQVTAALDRWGILPDDSAGTPPQLTPPGRFMRHVAGLFIRDLTAEALLTLLKHPLCHAGAGRSQHNLNTRDLELHIRRKGWPFPTAEKLLAWGEARNRSDWAAWVAHLFCQPPVAGPLPLTEWVKRHLDRAQGLCAGSESDDARVLWAESAGREVHKIVTDLQDQAPHGGDMTARDYADLFGAVLSKGEVRNPVTPHPTVLIWGTLEARVMGADLLILGALNEGTWPEMPKADPWLNRRMRHDAGLLVPERRIGLSAHDFQQAFGGQEVWVTLALKSQDAETVPSRWINRLINLLNGLPNRNGHAALDQMRGRGNEWLALARASEAPKPALPAPRPAPRPPVAARPRHLSVTEIQHLIRNPYAIYAKHVLNLRPLMPLQRTADPMIRGTVIHDIFQQFIAETMEDSDRLTRARLMQIAEEIVARDIPWPAIRHVWLARVDRVADWFIAREHQRRELAQPVMLEKKATARMSAPDFALTGKVDRIDMDTEGRAHVYDYKTGTPPTTSQQKHFDKQLLLEAAMIEQGVFKPLFPQYVAQAVYIGLGATPREQTAPLDEITPSELWDQFGKLIAAYDDPDRGYPARNASFSEHEVTDYDQLSRFGEWDGAQPPDDEVLE
ncbi:double-strand break repair protein AddB [Mesobacterium sp. TK19101]|uniref:Double-strand break repair protein AddB n=1 Tax=Mesobacterium hydrothermale TaxID=3111907 RepID=A0ABU6HGL5_9RHOB|nr:double-strand break repair protein AddB [Mesobacterium sp. TK19101]MEC3861600.1 double-strand break repair protein AddB [Mesobacterium sp. TK19101]